MPALYPRAVLFTDTNPPSPIARDYTKQLENQKNYCKWE